MKLGKLDSNQRVLVIAEIGNNHEGSFTRAEEMLGRAAEAGADVVKFQTFIPELFISATDTARRERLGGFQLSFEQFAKLATLAADCGVEFLSTPLDMESFRFLDGISPAFKIASSDSTFLPLLDAAARTAKPVILSTGLADHALIEQAIARFETGWKQAGKRGELALLHCVVAYPTPPDQANVGAIATLARAYPGCTVGYSDHTLGIEATVLSVAAGARIVEKHFTLDKNFSDFRDHQLSADPADLKRMVERIREAEILLGTGSKAPQQAELAIESAVRRSIAAGVDLPAGTVLTAEQLTWVRPSGGFAPGREAELVGRRLARAYARGEVIDAADLN